ncbi:MULTISPECIES: ribosome maturation factor RimM [Exiguobacterium]|uniref:Ribosome maturation factor RimM n=1 Tax=Exiguobacterium chiriqhucha RW-2 TaxID=1345023 RepID=U1LV39_9BACL|nr:MULTISPECIES: ribosome maturation factor RimM [Exiguobacterium]ERG66474.1 16S rRNA-processing protein RimM [Exiguobacterium chiriqhucha RW-2]KAB2863043.1 MAG: ribosome maturation factor RimM [Exiguobacterium chiriqhucha]MCT4777975.1 ribosome maturation factor RimM [Exiguobacterium aquaticum]MCT4787997.1 ribosome maturation factor RimM [Exiguobacterium mexicanum]TCI73875.1 ribosome maturation factor RimM [Exiguobacterium sp. IPCI3]
MEWLYVGKIANTHGLKGELKLLAATDFPAERFKKGETLYLDVDGKKLPFEVTTYRPHKQFHLVTFKGLENINLVEKYKGMKLYVHVEHVHELPEHEFYYHEIIGCEAVVDGEVIGVVDDIFETGANDVWVIKRPGKSDALIPYIESVVSDIDVEAKRVVITPIPGMIDDED